MPKNRNSEKKNYRVGVNVEQTLGIDIFSGSTWKNPALDGSTVILGVP